MSGRQAAVDPENSMLYLFLKLDALSLEQYVLLVKSSWQLSEHCS
jgi:hypothetical protein